MLSFSISRENFVTIFSRAGLFSTNQVAIRAAKSKIEKTQGIILDRINFVTSILRFITSTVNEPDGVALVTAPDLAIKEF